MQYKGRGGTLVQHIHMTPQDQTMKVVDDHEQDLPESQDQLTDPRESEARGLAMTLGRGEEREIVHRN